VQGPFPGADRVFERALALPFHTALREDEVERVVSVLAHFV
jgi:dTDP-4-amino-4,6-dideoxygalactose transaminase